MELLLTRNLVDKHNNYPDYSMIIITHTHVREFRIDVLFNRHTHTHKWLFQRHMWVYSGSFFYCLNWKLLSKNKTVFFLFFGRHRQRWWRWWRRQVWLWSNFFFWLLLLLLEHTATTTTTTNHSCIFVGLVFHWFRPPVYYAVKKKCCFCFLCYSCVHGLFIAISCFFSNLFFCCWSKFNNNNNRILFMSYDFQNFHKKLVLIRKKIIMFWQFERFLRTKTKTFSILEIMFKSSQPIDYIIIIIIIEKGW